MDKDKWARLKRLVPIVGSSPDKNSKHVGSFHGGLTANRGTTHKTGRPTKGDGLSNHARVVARREKRLKRAIEAVQPYI